MVMALVKSNRKLFCFLLLAAIVSFLTFLYYRITTNGFFEISISEQELELSRNNPNAAGREKTACLNPIRSKIVHCLLTGLKKDSHGSIWEMLPKQIQWCSGFLRKNLHIVSVKNKDDEKYVILPSRLYRTGAATGNIREESEKNKECIVHTIGIGSDIEAEMQLKTLRPECKFVGADPIADSGRVYSKIGTYLETAVGDGSMDFVQASVLIGDVYLTRNVSSMNFLHIFNVSQSNTIDYLFLDAEGAEYRILPMLSRRILAQFAVCQISIEIHGFAQQYKMTERRFTGLIFDLLEQSGHVPVLATHWGRFVRMFLIDVQSPECIDRYLVNFCSENAHKFMLAANRVT